MLLHVCRPSCVQPFPPKGAACIRSPSRSRPIVTRERCKIGKPHAVTSLIRWARGSGRMVYGGEKLGGRSQYAVEGAQGMASGCQWRRCCLFRFYLYKSQVNDSHFPGNLAAYITTRTSSGHDLLGNLI